MPTNSQFPRIAIVDIPNKGKGVIAKEYIAPGTLIISERPKIILPDHKTRIEIILNALSKVDKEFLLSFPTLPGDSTDALVRRLGNFTPCGDDGGGLCETICRVNHTCYSPYGSPNSSYHWNAERKEEELWAIKEIHPGQEIEVSYTDPTAYQSSAKLKEIYGFECRCPGCIRPQAEREASQKRFSAYSLYLHFSKLSLRLGRKTALQSLVDLESHILVLCEEGATFDIAPRSKDAFELCASCGDAANARLWVEIARDVYGLYFGTESKECKEAQKWAANPQECAAWLSSGERDTLKGPNDRIRAYLQRRHFDSSPSAHLEDSAGVLG